MNKTVCGVGINDAGYKIRPTVDGEVSRCPFYRVWGNMLERCYSKKYHERQPTYIGCTVCEEWLTFSNFKKWMEKQDFKGKQLDKDLLIQGSKEYSPETCIFILKSTNTLLIDCSSTRGKNPLGVSWNMEKSKFLSKVSIKGKTKFLGYFTTPLEAHAAWQQAKKDIIYNVALEQTDIRLKDALLLRYTQLQEHISKGLETKKL